MRALTPWIVLLFLTACAGGPAAIIDGKKFLETLDGPKVPTIKDTLTQAGQEAEKQGDYAAAASIYKQVLEKNPDNQEVQLMYAEAMRRDGEYDIAIGAYDDLIKKDASMISAKEGKALALISKGDFETPAPLLEEVMKADPKRWKTLNALGILFTTRNLQSEARQYFSEALKHSPSNISVMNNLGLSHALDRNFDAALDMLQKAGNLTTANSSERTRVDLNTALVYAVAGKLEDAKVIAQAYYSGRELDNNLGLYAHLANDNDMAKSYLNMALTNSKTFYAKAWDNLQAINNAGASNKPKAVKEKPAKEKETAPKDSSNADDAIGKALKAN